MPWEAGPLLSRPANWPCANMLHSVAAVCCMGCQSALHQDRHRKREQRLSIQAAMIVAGCQNGHAGSACTSEGDLVAWWWKYLNASHALQAVQSLQLCHCAALHPCQHSRQPQTATLQRHAGLLGVKPLYDQLACTAGTRVHPFATSAQCFKCDVSASQTVMLCTTATKACRAHLDLPCLCMRQGRWGQYLGPHWGSWTGLGVQHTAQEGDCFEAPQDCPCHSWQHPGCSPMQQLPLPCCSANIHTLLLLACCLGISYSDCPLQRLYTTAGFSCAHTALLAAAAGDTHLYPQYDVMGTDQTAHHARLQHGIGRSAHLHVVAV